MITPNIEYLDIDMIDSIVADNEGVMFVECYKYSKGPLFIVEPVMKKLQESGILNFKHYRVNLLEQPLIEDKYQIEVVPCYLIFSKNELNAKIYGVTAFHEYVNRLLP